MIRKRRRFIENGYHHEAEWRSRQSGLYPRVRTLLLGGCIVIAIIVLGAAVLYSRLFTIEFIDIEATGGIDAQEARAHIFSQMERARFGFLPQKNILFFSSESLNEDLARRYAVSSVSTSKHLPHTLRVHIEGKPFRLLLLQNGRVQDLASDGRVLIDMTDDRLYNQPSVEYARTLAASPAFETVPLPKDDPDTPLLRGLEGQLDEDTVSFVRELFSLAKTRGYRPLYFTLSTEDPVLEMRTREGWKVLFTPLDSAEKQVSHVQSILDTYFKDSPRTLEYIDVRFDNRLFFK